MAHLVSGSCTALDLWNPFGLKWKVRGTGDGRLRGRGGKRSQVANRGRDWTISPFIYFVPGGDFCSPGGMQRGIGPYFRTGYQVLI